MGPFFLKICYFLGNMWRNKLEKRRPWQCLCDVSNETLTCRKIGQNHLFHIWAQICLFLLTTTTSVRNPAGPIFQKNVIHTISTFRIKNNITNSSTAGKCIKTRAGDTESMSSQLAVHCTLYTHTRADKILQNAKKLHFHYSIT